MPSRKKARGKARKAAKEAAKAKESQAVVEFEVEASADQRQGQVEMENGSLEAQMQRLGINAVNYPEKCDHGKASLPRVEEKILHDFINAFIAAGVVTSRSRVSVHLFDIIRAARRATEEEYADVYSSKLEAVVSMLVSAGTQCILNGDNKKAQFYASLACHFEDWTAVYVRQTKAVTNWPKIIELEDADDHTLVQYYRKHVSCTCLDEKYKEVKSVKKMGWCCNPSCSKPNQMAERSKMFCCARCGEANYCSTECQKAHWKSHKEFCNDIAEVKASLDSEQQS